MVFYKNRADIMGNFTEYTLKAGSIALQRAILGAVLLFLITLPVMGPPMSDFSFPAPITEAAELTALVLGVVIMVGLLVFMFHRKQVKVSLDETGIQLPNHSFITWQSIQWYRIDFLAAKSGIRRLALKANGSKAVFVAQEGVAWSALTDDIKQRLRLHNPLAKDFRELPSSQIRAFIYIAILVAIHLIISIQTNFERKYLLIFTPVLLITIVAVLIEHIKMPDKQG